jgi:hypothetical protein
MNENDLNASTNEREREYGDASAPDWLYLRSVWMLPCTRRRPRWPRGEFGDERTPPDAVAVPEDVPASRAQPKRGRASLNFPE